MTVRLTRAGPVPPQREAAGTRPPRWKCAFVNNMPDTAFGSTERQFLDLLSAASGPDAIEVRRYAMVGIARGARTAGRIANEYGRLEELRADPPDLLIVTGSEPTAQAIQDEPHWVELAGLLCWAVERVPSTLLSCLSAHAALAVFDDIARTRLDAKCTGVFPQDVDLTHPLAAGLGSPVVLPHSRVNGVPSAAVEAAGYQLVLQSKLTGWSLVTKTVGSSGVVLVQGHPEYGPSSLLREYHRDLKRYLLEQRDELPCLPVHCAAGDDWAKLQRLQQQLVNGARDPALIDSFPFELAGARADWPWRSLAVTLYANWLTRVTRG